MCVVVIVSVPAVESVAEEDEHVRVCAELTALENTEKDVDATLVTANETGKQSYTLLCNSESLKNMLSTCWT